MTDRELQEMRAEKAQLFAQAIEHGLVTVGFQVGFEGVVVPHEFRQETHLVLAFSKKFTTAPPEYDDAGVFQVLTFKDQNLGVYVPWDAVTAIKTAGDHQQTWPELFLAEIVLKH